jgi:hypothetical protein
MNLAFVGFVLVIASPFLVVLFLYLGQPRSPGTTDSGRAGKG